MSADNTIKVPYTCKCGKKMLVKKKAATRTCSVKCPDCGNEYRIAFDIKADPQTYSFVDNTVNNDTIYMGQSGNKTADSQSQQGKKTEKTRLVNIDEILPPDFEEDEPVHAALGPCDVWLVKLKMFNLSAERYQLKYGETTIGRFDVAEQSDIPIRHDESISRRSVCINITPYSNFTEYRMTVLKATNPVFVNGKKIPEGKYALLANGDKIRLGNTKFRFEINQ